MSSYIHSGQKLNDCLAVPPPYTHLGQYVQNQAGQHGVNIMRDANYSLAPTWIVGQLVT
jgi:hypothetical protein